MYDSLVKVGKLVDSPHVYTLVYTCHRWSTSSPPLSLSFSLLLSLSLPFFLCSPSPGLWYQWYMKIENSSLARVFVGQVRSSLKCKHCETESNTFDPFWELSVSIPQVRVSIRQELNSYWHSLYCIDSSSTSYKCTHTDYLYVLKSFRCVYFAIFPCAEKSAIFSHVLKL